MKMMRLKNSLRKPSRTGGEGLFIFRPFAKPTQLRQTKYKFSSFSAQRPNVSMSQRPTRMPFLDFFIDSIIRLFLPIQLICRIQQAMKKEDRLSRRSLVLIIYHTTDNGKARGWIAVRP